MMTQEPSPQITLCIPILNEEKNLPELFSNLNSFFEKFHIPFEVVFCLDPSQDQSERLLREAQQKDPSYRYFQNPRPLGRARSLIRAIKEASAPYIAATSADLTTPLGDITKLLQKIGEMNSAIVFGDRIGKRDSPFLSSTSKKSRLEITYMNIFWEKNNRRFKDPFCSTFVLKKEIRDLLLSDLKTSGWDLGWYLTPALQEQVLKKNIPFAEVPVYASSFYRKSFPYYRESLRLFLRSLGHQRQ